MFSRFYSNDFNKEQDACYVFILSCFYELLLKDFAFSTRHYGMDTQLSICERDSDISSEATDVVCAFL